MEILPDHGYGGFLITEVTPGGLIDAWNNTNPELDVRPGDMIMIELDDQDGNNGAGPFHGLADDSALQISMVVESVTIQGHSGTSSQTLEVRLHDVT